MGVALVVTIQDGAGVGLAGLAATLFPCGFLSWVTGGHAAGGLGRLRVLCRPQHCSCDGERGLSGKAAHLAMTEVGPGETRGVEDGFPQTPGTSFGSAGS